MPSVRSSQEEVMTQQPTAATPPAATGPRSGQCSRGSPRGSPRREVGTLVATVIDKVPTSEPILSSAQPERASSARRMAAMQRGGCLPTEPCAAVVEVGTGLIERSLGVVLPATQLMKFSASVRLWRTRRFRCRGPRCLVGRVVECIRALLHTRVVGPLGGGPVAEDRGASAVALGGEVVLAAGSLASVGLAAGEEAERREERECGKEGVGARHGRGSRTLF